MKARLLIAFYMMTAALPGAAQSAKSLKDFAGWHKNYTAERQGANVQAALDLLKKHGKKPAGPVVVGIVDSGVDTTVVSLKGALWTNPGERTDGRDNDQNGYTDDVHGWNFLGTADGKFNMTSAGTEEYRQFKRLYPKYKNTASRDSAADKQEYDFYLRMRKKANIDNYLRYYEIANKSKDNLDSLSLTRLAEMEKNIYGIEHDQDKRLLMGDNMDDADDRFYGNPTLTIEGCEHGTFVAGIIAGDAQQDRRFDGIAPDVARLMIVRASPDGDEYDKDIASSIRYAVDNGARVINISLGKYYSPQERMVNDAIRYAADRDVLVICAAGNNSCNLDTIPSYPSGVDRMGRFLPNFLRIGASDEQSHCAKMSNYGCKTVHLFAPGTYMASVFPGDAFPAFNAADQLTFENGKLTPALQSTLKNFFTGEATYEELPGTYSLHTGVGAVAELTILKVTGVNRNFDAASTSESNVAYIGLRQIEDEDADEAGTMLLDVYLIDYESSSFATELKEFDMYAPDMEGNPYLAYMAGMYINFIMK